MGLGQRCFCLLEELEADEAGVGPKEQGKSAPTATFDFPIFTDFYRFLGLSWETSSQK